MRIVKSKKESSKENKFLVCRFIDGKLVYEFKTFEERKNMSFEEMQEYFSYSGNFYPNRVRKISGLPFVKINEAMADDYFDKYAKDGIILISASRDEIDGNDISSEENEKRTEELRKQIVKHGYKYIPVKGGYKYLLGDTESFSYEDTFVIPIGIPLEEQTIEDIADFWEFGEEMRDMFDQDSFFIQHEEFAPGGIYWKQDIDIEKMFRDAIIDDDEQIYFTKFPDGSKFTALENKSFIDRYKKNKGYDLMYCATKSPWMSSMHKRAVDGEIFVKWFSENETN